MFVPNTKILVKQVDLGCRVMSYLTHLLDELRLMNENCVFTCVCVVSQIASPNKYIRKLNIILFIVQHL